MRGFTREVIVCHFGLPTARSFHCASEGKQIELKRSISLCWLYDKVHCHDDAIEYPR